MVDFHTHILPGIDDGSSGAAESRALLAASFAQGIKVICLTPHFYSHRETIDSFLSRRKEAHARLMDACAGLEIPELRLGAEVAFYHGIGKSADLKQLCIDGSSCVLVEMPFFPWTSGTLNDVFSISASLSLTPVLAHIERYSGYFDGNQKLTGLLEMGALVQINAETIISRRTRKCALALLLGGNCLLGSDCHNTDERPQNMGQAVKIIRKAIGNAETDRVLETGLL